MSWVPRVASMVTTVAAGRRRGAVRRITIAARRSVVKAVAVAETDSNPPRGRFRNGTKPAGRQIDFNPRTARSCCRIDLARQAGSPEQ